jgi:hypothetical protein
MSLLTLFFAGMLSAPAQGASPCPEQVSTATLAQHISAADLAFSSMDENAFRAARWSAQRSLTCMGEAIQSGQAAAYYRMEALGSFLDQNHAQSVGFFKSMLRVAPHYILPEPMAPSGHPLRVDFEVAQGTAHVPGDPVPKPKDGVIRVDGGVAVEFPRDRPYLFQHQTMDGAIPVTAVVGIGVEYPHYATQRGWQSKASGSRRTQTVDKVKRKGGPNVNVPLAIVSGGSALVSGITYLLAARKAAEFEDPATPKSELGDLRDSTNSLVLVSGTFATVAVGTGVAAFMVGGEF